MGEYNQKSSIVLGGKMPKFRLESLFSFFNTFNLLNSNY